MINRRAALATLAAVAATPAFAQTSPGPFVTREGAALKLGGRPYRFVGANMWYAAWLGADSEHGDRPRLSRELDALAGDGAANLRIAPPPSCRPCATRSGPPSATRAPTTTKRSSSASTTRWRRWPSAT